MIYGIDIGGTKIEIAVFDEALLQKDNWRITTPQDCYQTFIEKLAELIHEADEKYNCTGKVGLAMAGLLDPNGLSLSANIPVLNGKNVAKDLEKTIKRPVVNENDCRCFALSEALGGAGEGFESIYGAIVGTGLAGGYVVDGALQKGKQNIIGESGHIQISASLTEKYNLPLRQCGCGLVGCYEKYISGPGMIFIHQHLHQEEMTTFEIIERWRGKDEAAEKTMECYFDIMGSFFASLVLNFDPHAIILGGGMSLIEEIPDRLPHYISKFLFKDFIAPPIIRAKFGDASGARGAALLAREKLS